MLVHVTPPQEIVIVAPHRSASQIKYKPTVQPFATLTYQVAPALKHNPNNENIHEICDCSVHKRKPATKPTAQGYDSKGHRIYRSANHDGQNSETGDTSMKESDENPVEGEFGWDGKQNDMLEPEN